MHECPHCNEPGISTVRKLVLGPAIPATCQECGGQVGVPWVKSLATLVVAFGGIGLGQSTGSLPLTIIFSLAGLLVAGYLYHAWVPLERRR